MRTKSWIILILVCQVAAAQNQTNQAENYNQVTDFKIGDNIEFNQPSNGSEYRSVYYTYEAAKNIRPDLKPYDTEKIYLSDQFHNAPFTIVSFDGQIATLAYGIMKNFALVDLELAIRSGELGDRTNMAPIWLISEINKGDQIQLKIIDREQYGSSWFTPKFVRKELNRKTNDRQYLPSVYGGSTFTLANKWDNEALLANDTAKEIAYLDLKKAIELDEIELNPVNFIANEPEIITSDSLIMIEEDTVPKTTFLDRWGIGLYLGPFYEYAPKESMSSVYGLVVGAVIKNKWQAGLYIQDYGGSFSETIIFPNSFALDHTHVGGFLAYPILLKGPWSLLVETRVGTGEAIWSMDQSSDVLDSDRFTFINPRLGVDYRFGRLAMMNLGIGYRMAKGLDITELSNSALNGFHISIMLKVGWLNKEKDEE